MEWYGSIESRLEENRMLNGCKEIEVGTPCTEYLYSDREPYEVVEVKDQKHIKIRKLDWKRVDGGGFSEFQEYEYKSNEENEVIELVYKYNHWYRRNNKYADKQFSKINISFGKAERYYDFSF